MYGLRCVTNHYGMYGGARSDSLIFGHPEYQRGRVGSEMGMGPGWVPRGPTRRSRSLVMDKIKASASLNSPRRMHKSTHRATAASEPRNDVVEEGASKAGTGTPLRGSRSSGELLPRLQHAGAARIGNSDAGNDLNSFMEELGSSSSLPVFSRENFANAPTRHYQTLRAQLTGLRERYRRDPEGTRRDLARSGKWKAYAQALRDIGTRRIWNEELMDGTMQQGEHQQMFGRFKYVPPESARPFMEASLYKARPIVA